MCTNRDNSRSIKDVAFLALTVLSLIPSLDSYTVRGKQNLTYIKAESFFKIKIILNNLFQNIRA